MDNGKRLCIYFFYDLDGIADRYVDYYLAGLMQVVDRLIVVSNGALTDQARALFHRHTEEVWERENEGFDVWAYKTSMERIGWESLREYHEVILANATLMGPVYPFSEMFDAMEQRPELDFWGITTFGALEDDPFGANPYGCLPEHIQSHFVVYRNRFLQAAALEQYWKDMPMIESYEESVGRHESYFTRFFAEQGFLWDVYVHTPDYDYTPHYIMMDPVRAIREDRCPVFKRRSFFHPQSHYLIESAGEQPWELFRYLKNHTDYDTDMIVENLVRTCHQDDIARTLRLTYVLPSQDLLGDGQTHSRVACVMHLYYMDLLDESLHYASALPEDADLYITTPKEESIPLIREAFSALPNRLEIRRIENRGRDVSALLVGAADLQDKYDLICFYHDKKTAQAKPYTIGRSFSYKTAECVLGSKCYVRNVIATFERNHRLGMLSCTVPNHALFLPTLCMEWGNNYHNTKALARELGLRVPIDGTHVPVAPLGTVFWYRCAAMRPLFEKNWRYEDFPPEPNANDGTLLHAIERIYAFTVQAAGYLPGRVMPDHLAALEIDNLTYYVTNYNLVRLKNGITGNFEEVMALEEKRFHHGLIPFWLYVRLPKIKKYLKKHLPRKWFLRILRLKRALFGRDRRSQGLDTEGSEE